MWLIAGLGNPGRKYLRTRHNIGFMVIDEIAHRYSIELKERKEYRIGRGSTDDRKIVLIEPLLYMNMSGPVIKKMLSKLNVKPENLIVIHDDIDMEAGKLKIKRYGSSGGHKGVESIIQSIDSKNFIRLKIGIGRKEDIPPEEYVLSKFSREEMIIFKNTIKKAEEAVESIISEGVDKAMNKFN